MIVGIPKEIKNNENRVSLTPAGAHELVQRGHTVYIQHTAGINSGFSDEEYEKVGARILPTIEDVYAIAEMIIKVKEPIECEYNLVRKGQLVFTYFHFACDKELTEAMMRSGSVCLAYETVTDKQGCMEGCEDVKIEQVTLQDAANVAEIYKDCHNVTVDKVVVNAGASDRKAISISGCDGVKMTDCYFNMAGNPLESAGTSRNLIFTNCITPDGKAVSSDQ